MAIHVVCFSCGAMLKAPERMAGHSAFCPKCGDVIWIALPSAPPILPPTSKPTTARPGRAAIFAAVLVVVLILAAIFKIGGTRDQPQPPDPQALAVMREASVLQDASNPRDAPARQEAIEEPPPKKPEPPAAEAKLEPEPEWVDLGKSFARKRYWVVHNDIAISPDDFVVDYVQLFHWSYWDGKIDDEKYDSKEKLLKIRIWTKNFGDTPRAVGSDYTWANDPKIQLIDNSGNKLEKCRFKGTHQVKGFHPSGHDVEPAGVGKPGGSMITDFSVKDIYGGKPGSLIHDVIVFEPPRKDVEYLRLTLEDYVKGEKFYLQIPRKLIEFK